MNQMHSEMMTGGGGAMMIGTGLIGLLIVALPLAIAALVKYLRTPGAR